MTAIRDVLLQDAALFAEFVASQSEFFPHGVSGNGPTEQALARQRHQEWFLLDRPSAHLGVRPIDALLERSRSEVATIGAEELSTFLNSHASVFEVSETDPDRGVLLRDLAGMGQYAAAEPAIGEALVPGDLVVGRVFALGGGDYEISPAAGIFRDPTLAAAIVTDLDRARARPRGVLRMSQLDLELMFFQGGMNVETADAVEAAKRLLLDAGLTREDADGVLRRLASEPLVPDPLPATAAASLREVLDRLAFESAVDLDLAQRTLLEAWATLAPKEGPAKRSGPGEPAAKSGAHRERARETRGEAAIHEFFDEIQKRRAGGESIESLFDDLERKLELAEVPGTFEEEDTPAPDFPGVVAAIVHEFLWEIELEEGAARARAFECLNSLGRFAQHIGVLENLERRDLLTYTCFWLLEQRELDDAEAARGLLRALERFLTWADATQGLSLRESFQSDLESLRTTLPPVVDANRLLPRADASTPGELFECVEFGAGSRARVRDRAGSEHWLKLEPAPVAELPVGSAFRGHQRDGRAVVLQWYPPLVRELRPA